MIVDDEYFPAVECSSLEEHLDLCRTLAYLGTGDNFIVREKPRECLLRSCIWEENNGLTRS